MLGTGRGNNALSPRWCLESVGRYSRLGRLDDGVLGDLLGEMCNHLRSQVISEWGGRRVFNGYRLWRMRQGVVEKVMARKSFLPKYDWEQSAFFVQRCYDQWYPLPGNGRQVVEEFDWFDIRPELEERMLEDGVAEFPRAELVCLVDILKRLSMCTEWSRSLMEELFL